MQSYQLFFGLECLHFLSYKARTGWGLQKTDNLGRSVLHRTMSKPLPPFEDLDELFTTDGLDLFARKNGKPYSRTKKEKSIVKLEGTSFLITRVVWALTHREDPGRRAVVQKDKTRGWHVDNLELIARGRPKNPENAHLPERVTRHSSGKFQVTGITPYFLRDKSGYKPEITGTFDTLEEAAYKAAHDRAWADRIDKLAAMGDNQVFRYLMDPGTPDGEHFDLIDGVFVLRNPEDFPDVDENGFRPGGSPPYRFPGKHGWVWK